MEDGSSICFFTLVAVAVVLVVLDIATNGNFGRIMLKIKEYLEKLHHADTTRTLSAVTLFVTDVKTNRKAEFRRMLNPPEEFDSLETLMDILQDVAEMDNLDPTTLTTLNAKMDEVPVTNEDLSVIPQGTKVDFYVKTFASVSLAEFFRKLERPIVPAALSIKKILPASFKYDFFSVNALELFRKATDELALGLHFFVLTTLIHSHTKSPITFRSSKELVPNQDGSVDQMHTVEFSFTEADNCDHKALLDFMLKFRKSTSTFDVRKLLQHVQNVNFNHPQKRYYNADIVKACDNLKRLITNIFHRNHFSSCHSLGEITEAGITKGEISYAFQMELKFIQAGFFYLTEVLKNIKTDFKPLPEMGSKPFFHKAIKELKVVFKNHMKNVENLTALYRKMCFSFSEQPELELSEGTQKRILKDLLRSMENEAVSTEGGNLPPRIQYALQMLWTRFGVLSQSKERLLKKIVTQQGRGNSRANKTAETPSHLSATVVTRYKLRRNDDTFLTFERDSFFFGYSTSWKHNPVGITHQDFLNRSLDVCNCALRDILLRLCRKYDQDPTSLDPIPSSIVDEMKLVEGKKLVDDVPVDGLNLRRENGEPTTLYEEFERLCEESNVPATMERFVRHDAHWVDPRFISEFLRRLNDPFSSAYLIPKAAQLIKFRDLASHNLHLFDRSTEHYDNSSPPRRLDSLDGDKLRTSLETLRELVFDLCRLTGIDQESIFIEASQAMPDIFPFYIRWRSRERFALESEDNTERTKLAFDCVKALSEHTLHRVTNLPSETDGSPESLQAWLSLISFSRQPNGRENNIYEWIEDDDEEESEEEDGEED